VAYGNICYGGAFGIAGDSGTGFTGAHEVYANTVADCTTGIADRKTSGTGSVTGWNNAVAGCTTSWSAVAGGSNNASDTGTPPGTGAVTGIATSVFRDYAARDLRLTPAGANALVDAGADLSGFTYPPTPDGKGTPRPQGGAWDIGADERA
jgi:hypothetical protein